MGGFGRLPEGVPEWGQVQQSLFKDEEKNGKVCVQNGCDVQREELPFPCPAHLLSGSLDLCLASPWVGKLEQQEEEAVGALPTSHRFAFAPQL